VRLGYLVSIIVWSGFSFAHSLIRPGAGLIGFLIVRFGLGLGEAGNFPAAIKAVSTWFPAKERALAIGLFNAGSNVGAILAPLLVLLVVQPSGADWQLAFVITSGLSALWCVMWLFTYREPEHHPRVMEAELSLIRADRSRAEDKPRLSGWQDVIRQPITWGVSLLRLADAAWWFYIFWGGKFLFDRFGLNIRTLALPLVTIYVLADIGSISGGWISSHLIQRGWSAVRARKFTMLTCALLIVPVTSVTSIDTQWYWMATLLIGLAAAAHQAWAANMFALIGDYLPQEAVASVTGISGTVGVLAGLVTDFLVGRVLTYGGDGYFLAFMSAGTLYLVVLGLFHLLVAAPLSSCASQTV
jgi:MFS transporter, ACS family, hexuronate transporter